MSDEQMTLDQKLIKWLRDDSMEHKAFFPSDGSYFKMHNQAADRIEELTKLVEKLPVTADGVRVVPGMGVWFVYDDGSGVCNDFAPDFEMSDGKWNLYYSTKEAALAATQNGGAA
tara:strand:- start:402259 stop:402603 length:345 start_codon:yes stop_codon:yes gene_type:complete